MPSTFSVDVGENVVVAEVFYDYKPFLFEGLFQRSDLRHTTFTRPRGSLLRDRSRLLSRLGRAATIRRSRRKCRPLSLIVDGALTAHSHRLGAFR